MSDKQDEQEYEPTLCISDLMIRCIEARLDVSETIRHVLIGSVELFHSIVD